MITFKKFINESEKEYYITDIQEIADIIKRDCKKWIDEVRNPEEFPIFRGIKYGPEADGILHKRYMRTDRQPRDTVRKMHNFVDDWFNEKFGIKFRSQSIFVTGQAGSALEFGHVYIVFPIGDYDYCWSADFKDMTEDIDNAIRFRIDKLFKSGDLREEDLKYIKNHGFSSIVDIDNGKEILDYVLDEAGYVANRDLVKGIRMGNEIMISCDEYYILGPYKTLVRRDAIDKILNIL